MRTLIYRKPTIAASIVAMLAVTSPALLASKFFKDDPITTEPETQDASGVTAWKIDLFFDLMLNQFTRPGLPPGNRSANVNTIDEVPDSSWFTNRILTKPFSIEDLVRGPIENSGPAPGQLTVIRAKSEGAAPGFTVRDSAGTTWFVEFDPPGNPEASTGALVVAMRLFWALGYYQAEYHLSELTREQLQIYKAAMFEPPSGKARPMTIKDLDPVLARAGRNPNGSYRIVASRLLPGKILGGFRYYGTRPDDPNDIVPHELRRELRALQVFGAWTNLVDVKALNTMDTLITKDGRARVRHYLLDVGSTFGIGANGPHDWTDGYEHLFDKDKTLKRMVTLGLYLQPWQTVKYNQNPAIGRFEGDEFDPLKWTTRIPAAALLQARDDDTFWAARRVMAFTDDMIRAVVKTGRYTDPAAEKLLADILIKRRDKIGRAYFTRINPLVNFSMNESGVLKFENAAAKAGIVNTAGRWRAAWSIFKNETGTSTPLGATESAGQEFSAPPRLPSRTGTYVAADIQGIDPPHKSWAMPMRVTFCRTDTAWKLVGLDRMPGIEARSDRPESVSPSSAAQGQKTPASFK